MLLSIFIGKNDEDLFHQILDFSYKQSCFKHASMSSHL